MTFSQLMVSLAGPVVKRALSALGIGAISYGAIQVAFNQLQTTLLGLYGAFGGDFVWILDRAGISAAMGIILGAMSAKVGLMALSRLGKLQG